MDFYESSSKEEYKMAESTKNASTQKTLVLAQVGVLSALITVMTFIPYLGYISYGGLSITLLHIPVIIGAVVLGPKIGGLLGGVWGITCIMKAVLAPPTPLEGIIFRNPIIALIPRILVGFVAGGVFLLISKGGKKALSEKSEKILSAFVNTLLVLGAYFGVAFLVKKLFLKDAVSQSPTLVYTILIVLLVVVAAGAFALFYKNTRKKNVSAAGIATILATITNTALVMGGIYLFYGKDVGISSISFGGLTNFILAAFGINAILEIIIGYVLVVPISLALQKVRTRI